MLFVKTEKLKKGMRLARPIYNKDGVLLYERNSKLTAQGIQSIHTFGLIGLFILEPAEPVPPMTQEDILFERFQTMTVFALSEELNKLKDSKRGPKLQVIVNNILRRYGHLDKSINFIQNLRSKEDHVYKHALNTAILCAMITHVLNIKLEEQMDTVMAALVHEVGMLSLPKAVSEKEENNDAEKEVIASYKAAGFELIGRVFSAEPNIKRICVQSQKMMDNFKVSVEDKRFRPVMGAQVLTVATTYDTMTAMHLNAAPVSEVAALKHLLNHPEIYAPEIVDALIESVNILVPGVSVELNTGEKAIVIRKNKENVLRPMVLGFKDNNIMDLAEKSYSDLEVVDIMKTMDNRCIIDTKTLREHGIHVPELEEAELHTGIAEENMEVEEYIPGQFF
jgi:HD-GYP domain-containing protein (c-di-GMP phosphodiesterase class II)